MEKKMIYKEAKAYLDTFQFHGFRLGLERMEAILEALGNPHLAYPAIHVAGTNGKGSTCAFLSSILAEAGYKTGLYTSPHLFSLTERFKINQENISEEELAALIQEIKVLVEKGYELSYFEYTTAIAMLWFARQKVDIALFETGLGGRLDATNVIIPEISIITNVSLDHQSYLGSTIKEIAWEKAGIIKEGVPVVSSVITSEAENVIAKRCLDLKAPLYKLNRDFFVKSIDIMHMNYQGKKLSLEKAPLGLLGSHQAFNAALATMSSELLSQQSWKIRKLDVQAGLAHARWPGRGELLYGHCLVLLDGAHNLDGTVKLRDLLSGLKELNIPGPQQKHFLVWACSNEGKDKDFVAMLKEVAPFFNSIIITEPPGPRNPVKIAQWREHLHALPDKIVLSEQWQEAIDKSIELAGPKDLVCVAGSLYLVGAAREKLLNKGWKRWIPKI